MTASPGDVIRFNVPVPSGFFARLRFWIFGPTHQETKKAALRAVRKSELNGTRLDGVILDEYAFMTGRAE